MWVSIYVCLEKGRNKEQACVCLTNFCFITSLTQSQSCFHSFCPNSLPFLASSCVEAESDARARILQRRFQSLFSHCLTRPIRWFASFPSLAWATIGFQSISGTYTEIQLGGLYYPRILFINKEPKNTRLIEFLYVNRKVIEDFERILCIHRPILCVTNCVNGHRN